MQAWATMRTECYSFDVVASLVCGSFPIFVCGDLIREIAHPPHVERETDVPDEDKGL